MNSTIQPKNYEEWIKSAPIEELVQGLYERLNLANAQIITLQMELNNTKKGIISHTHDSQTGEPTLPLRSVLKVGD